MRLTLTFHGDISGGKITGEVNLLKEKNHMNVGIDNANVNGIPLFEVMGLSGKGTLSGEFRLKDGTGDLKFSLKDAQFESTSFSGVIIPVNLFQSATGAMTIDGDLVRIGSLSLQGNGIYARVKGNIRNNVMDLIIELMQDSSFTDKSSILFLLENYKVSPGYYVIPVKGSIPF
jgi:type II secretion system protein N